MWNLVELEFFVKISRGDIFADRRISKTLRRQILWIDENYTKSAKIVYAEINLCEN